MPSSPNCDQDQTTTMRLLMQAAVPNPAPGWMVSMFSGRFEWDLAHPFPAQEAGDRAAGDALVASALEFVTGHFDPTTIDQESALPADFAALMHASGLLRLAVPRAYGGDQITATNLYRVIEAIYGWSGPVGMSVALQAMCVAYAAYMSDTRAQARFYRDVMDGAICSLAATESHGASNLISCTTAVRSPERGDWVVNGEKVYIGNSTLASYLVVTVTTFAADAAGAQIPEATAFMAPANRPGFRIRSLQHYMGLHGLPNAHLGFEDFRVADTQLLGAAGDGFKVVLQVMPRAKLFIPSMCLATAKQCLSWARQYGTRPYMNVPLAQLDLTRAFYAETAATILAMESALSWITLKLDQTGQNVDNEMNVVKFAVSESAWAVVDRTMQLFAGQGYEQAPSLAARGQTPFPVERAFRDIRVQRMFGTTNELVMLSVAQTALSAAALGLAAGQTTAPDTDVSGSPGLDGENAGHLRWVEQEVRRFYKRNVELLQATMTETGKTANEALMTLINQQTRLVSIARITADLFLMTTVLSRAGSSASDANTRSLTDLFCRQARRRVRAEAASLEVDDSVLVATLADAVSSGALDALLDGVILTVPPAGGAASAPGASAPGASAPASSTPGASSSTPGASAPAARRATAPASTNVFRGAVDTHLAAGRVLGSHILAAEQSMLEGMAEAVRALKSGLGK